MYVTYAYSHIIHEIHSQPLDCAIYMCNYMHAYKYIYIHGGQRAHVWTEESLRNSLFHHSSKTPMTTENYNSSFRLEICCGESPSVSSLSS